MQFCTIDEAWGNKKIKENFKNDSIKKSVTESTESPKIEETFKPTKKSKKKLYFNHTEESMYEGFTDTINDKNVRNKLLERVLKSRRCRDVLRKKFRPNLVNKLNIMLDDYRDVIVLILVGFSIIVFLSMLYNLNK
jgi:hypothetical protein